MRKTRKIDAFYEVFIQIKYGYIVANQARRITVWEVGTMMHENSSTAEKSNLK